MSKKRYFKLSRPLHDSAYIVASLSITVGAVRAMMVEGDNGDKLLIEIVEMAEEEYENLPEFEDGNDE